MKRVRVYTLAVALAFSSTMLSCANDNDSKGFDINVKSDGGCPNVAEFHNRLSELGGSGWVRRHTVTMSAADRNSEGSSTPRANHLSMLAFSNFEFTEQPVEEYRSEAPSVSQEGCSRVAFGAMVYEIREASGDRIRMAQMVVDPTDTEPDPAKKRMIEKTSLTYIFTSSRSADIVSRHMAIDPCYGDRMIEVNKTTRFRWGPDGDGSREEPQEVDPSYIARATRALSSVPNAIRALSGQSGPTVLVPVADLRELKASPVRTDLKVCPYRPGPPDVDDPEMPSSETAVPTPTPAPEAAPAPETPVP